jgi:hypothetical protein
MDYNVIRAIVDEEERAGKWKADLQARPSTAAIDP